MRVLSRRHSQQLICQVAAREQKHQCFRLPQYELKISRTYSNYHFKVSSLVVATQVGVIGNLHDCVPSFFYLFT
jgi:hypothetical protein